MSFALSSDELARLLKAGTDRERLGVVEEIEQSWDEDHLCELDKAWYAIDRCLADDRRTPGQRLDKVVLGGKQIYEGDDYIINLVIADELPGLVEHLQRIDQRELRRRYDAMTDYEGPRGDEDFEYTWDYFTGFVEFLARASGEARAVLFTADQ